MLNVKAYLVDNKDKKVTPAIHFGLPGGGKSTYFDLYKQIEENRHDHYIDIL